METVSRKEVLADTWKMKLLHAHSLLANYDKGTYKIRRKSPVVINNKFKTKKVVDLELL